jgi:luciferase family oxidoreductase group 1
MPAPKIPVSVLDLSPVADGFTGADALRNTLDLAKLCDTLGFTRYWIAEHHNLPSIASSAPEIMIGQVAAATKNMRVGSGGVMLPNHAPLMVAERFKVLEALFPGRIDLGIGRAPGTDPVTSFALRRRQMEGEGDDFLERFQELILFERRQFPEGHPFRKVHAMPADIKLPPIWLLGSSGYSAQLAGMVGAGFSFAHHFSDYDAVAAMLSYRDHFRPSQARDKPCAMLGVAVVCADSDAEADRLATTLDLNWVRRARGEMMPLASPEEAQNFPYTPIDLERIRHRRARLFAGAPDTVISKLKPLIEATKADELIVTTMLYDHGARRHSYELLAEAFGLGKRQASPAD